MAYVLGYNLTPFAENIMKYLFEYRTMTAKQLATMICFPDPIDLSKEKSVYNYLRKLKKQGLVSAHKLQANVANGSLYYLTPKGYEYVKDYFEVQEGAIGEGWLYNFMLYSDSPKGDFPYEVYSPPLKQPAHHLMMIDFFIELIKRGGDIYTNKHRINLYAAKSYELDGKKSRFRPDAEILLDDQLYTVEIDRSTESHEQLVQKFLTYRDYFDYLSKNGLSHQIPKGILFVVESKRRDHGIKRRWNNVLAAYMKTLWVTYGHVNLILTELDSVGSTLEFEADRQELEKKASKQVKQTLLERGYVDTTSYVATTTKEIYYSHGISNSSYDLFFTAISHEFESKLYDRCFNFIECQYKIANDPEKIEKIKGLKFKSCSAIIFHHSHEPYIAEGILNYDVNPELTHIFKFFKERAEFINLENN